MANKVLKKKDDIVTNGCAKVPNSKVAIVGFAPSWHLAPYDDESFDIWGINELYLQAVNRRFTHWFEIHDPKSPSKNVEKHQNWLRNCKIPLYMQQHFEEYPMSIPYPRDKVKAMVNENFILEGCGSKYTDFSNQITWMIFFAIYIGYKEIHVYGVDMAQQSEHSWQRSSCQFALGLAAGKGIKILIPKTSELCKFPRDYGFETDNANRHLTKERINSLNKMIIGYKNQLSEIDYQYTSKHKDFKIIEQMIKDDLIKIGDEMVKMEISIAKNNEIANIINTMPGNKEEIEAKKGKLLKGIIDQNSLYQKSLKELEKEVKDLKQQLYVESCRDHINKMVLDESREKLVESINKSMGGIGECNYNLSNNRV